MRRSRYATVFRWRCSRAAVSARLLSAREERFQRRQQLRAIRAVVLIDRGQRLLVECAELRVAVQCQQQAMDAEVLEEGQRAGREEPPRDHQRPVRLAVPLRDSRRPDAGPPDPCRDDPTARPGPPGDGLAPRRRPARRRRAGTPARSSRRARRPAPTTPEPPKLADQGAHHVVGARRGGRWLRRDPQGDRQVRQRQVEAEPLGALQQRRVRRECAAQQVRHHVAPQPVLGLEHRALARKDQRADGGALRGAEGICPAERLVRRDQREERQRAVVGGDRRHDPADPVDLQAEALRRRIGGRNATPVDPGEQSGSGPLQRLDDLRRGPAG